MRVRVDEAWDDDALGCLDNSGVACRDSPLLEKIVSDGRNSAQVNENIGAIEMRALRARDDVGVADQNAGGWDSCSCLASSRTHQNCNATERRTQSRWWTRDGGE
jgi:hypothetical protein